MFRVIAMVRRCKMIYRLMYNYCKMIYQLEIVDLNRYVTCDIFDSQIASHKREFR